MMNRLQQIAKLVSALAGIVTGVLTLRRFWARRRETFAAQAIRSLRRRIRV